MIEKEKDYKVKKVKITTRNGKVILDSPEGETIRVKKEDKPDYWYRNRFNRYEDNLAHPQILRDINNISKMIMKLHPEGINYFSYTIPTKPMPLQKSSKKKEHRSLYKQRLDKEFKKNREQLKIFKDKKLFVYLCFYLRKRKYDGSDVQNYDDLILDALRPYVGDDRNFISVHSEKKQLDNYPKEDMDFYENTLIVIVESKYKKDILKAIAESEG